jgi:hypothetical protein
MDGRYESNSSSTPEAREAQHQIVDVLVACAAALDRRDWAALEQTFTADAVAYGAEGSDAVVATVRSFLGGCGPSQHLLGNHSVTVDDDIARSVCKVRALHVGAGDRSRLSWECCGNYVDEMVRTPEGWRIAKREFEVTVAQRDPSVLRPG